MKNFTSCEDCIFNLTRDGKQYGCYAKDLSHVDYEIQDNGSFKLKNRYCNFKRIESNGQLSKTLKQVRNQVKLNYATHTKCDNLDEAVQTFDNLIKCDLPPKKIYCYITHEIFKNSLSKHKCDIQSRTSTGRFELCIVEDISNELVLAMGMQKKGFSHHVFLSPDKANEIYSSFFEWLDVQVNDNDFRFKVITGDCIVIPEIMYYTSNMNVKSILDKAKTDSSCPDFNSLYKEFTNFSSWSAKEKRFK